jgi:hypothetical protein
MLAGLNPHVCALEKVGFVAKISTFGTFKAWICACFFLILMSAVRNTFEAVFNTLSCLKIIWDYTTQYAKDYHHPLLECL